MLQAPLVAADSPAGSGGSMTPCRVICRPSLSRGRLRIRWGAGLTPAPRPATPSSRAVVVRLGGDVMLAGDRRVVLREHAVGVLTVEPDVAVVMRSEHVRLVHRRRWVVLHGVEGDAVELRRFGVASRIPGLLEDQVLDRDE